ncbi:hypothetical protein C7N43_35090 [Sphingobacteriales bacterium UPWRP_1]|nr:hypothetical protein C7N43_35090 [Sphingobacteriales bacterium UPWRP_1]
MSIFNYFENKNVSYVKAIAHAKECAIEAGWKIKTEKEDHLVLGFKDELGLEHVFIRPCGSNRDDKVILEFSSEGIPLPDDVALASLFGLTLLERNGEMLMGHWGIETSGSKKYFTVMHSMVAEGMDVNEFKAAVRACIDEKKRLLLDMVQKGLKP